jgi:hypothetical protein
MPGIGIGNTIWRRGGGAASFDWTTKFPNDLYAIAQSDTEIDLLWTNNGISDYDGVGIERGTDGVNFTEIDTVAAGETGYSDSGLTMGVVYYYRIRYYKGSSYSSYSNIYNEFPTIPIYFRSAYECAETTGTIAIDSSIQYHGVIDAAVTLNQAGKINKAWLFNSATAKVSLGIASRVFNNGIDNWSVCLWFKTTSIGATDYVNRLLWFPRNISSSSNFLIATGDNDKLQFVYYDGATNVVDVMAISTNTWYHVAVVCNGTNFKIYVNNDLKQTVVDALTTAFGSYVGYCGNNAAANSAYIGYVEQILCFNTPISEALLSYIYNSGSGRSLTWMNRSRNVGVSWWSLIRGKYYNGKTYYMGSQSSGDVVVGTIDHTTKINNKIVIGDLGAQDDHYTPSLLVESDKPVIVFYVDHNGDGLVRYRKGIANASIDDLQVEATIDFGAILLSYSQVYREPGTDNLLLLTRGENEYWYYAISDDYGATWSGKTALFSFGAGEKGYLCTTQNGNILSVALYGHPTVGTIHEIYHCLINLNTGNIYKIDTTVLDNFKTPSSLPIDITTETTLVYNPAGDKIRLFDINSHNDIAIEEWTTDDDSVYKILFFNGSSWTLKTVVNAGVSVGSDAAAKAAHYQSGMSFPNPYQIGVVYLGRESGGIWYIEKWTTSDSGDTWISEKIKVSNDKLIRPYGIVDADTYEILFGLANTYVNYDEWDVDLHLK